MSEGYLLADTNSLIYAYRAGGPPLLDIYFKLAEIEDRKLAITKTVQVEIRNGPLRAELGNYIADRQVPIIDTPQIEQRLKAGAAPKNAGELSMLEVAAREHAQGRTTLIWSDDKYFASRDILRQSPGAQPVTSADLLDRAFKKGAAGRSATGELKYRQNMAGYQSQSLFQHGSASYSPRLDTFDPPQPGLRVRLGLADAAIAASPRFAVVAQGAGVAGAGLMAYDAATTARQYLALQQQGNPSGADALLHQYMGRTAGGLAAGAAAGAAYGLATGSWTGPGALATGAAGGVIGAFGGEAIARAHTWHQVNRQTGSDGLTYTYVHGPGSAPGRWELQPWLGSNSPAPQDQREVLEYKRSSAVTALALAHAPIRHAHDILPGDRALAMAQAFVMAYYGKGWDRHGPLPEHVTQGLQRPSEQRIADPATGQLWEATAQGFVRTEAAPRFGMARTLSAEGDALARLRQARQHIREANAQYGAGLIGQKYDEMLQRVRASPPDLQPPQAPSRPAATSGVRRASTGDPDLDRLAAAMGTHDDAAICRAIAVFADSPQLQSLMQQGRELLAAEQKEQREALEPARKTASHAMAR